MAIQRVNFNALAAGGDTPTGALVKLDNSCADLDSRKANVADFAIATGLNGYCKWPPQPGQYPPIYQWGTYVIQDGNTTGTVTFPVTFPHYCFVVLPTNGDANANQEARLGITGTTTSNFSVKNSANTGACRVNWFAIGN